MGSELSKLQAQIFDLQSKIKNLEDKVVNLESKVNIDVVEMRKEATKVLEKVTALVNPYSPNTITFGRK